MEFRESNPRSPASMFSTSYEDSNESNGDVESNCNEMSNYDELSNYDAQRAVWESKQHNLT